MEEGSNSRPRYGKPEFSTTQGSTPSGRMQHLTSRFSQFCFWKVLAFFGVLFFFFFSLNLFDWACLINTLR